MSTPLADALEAVQAALTEATATATPAPSIRIATQPVRPPCVMVGFAAPAAVPADRDTFTAATHAAWTISMQLTVIPTPSRGSDLTNLTRVLELTDTVIDSLPTLWKPQVESVHAIATADGADYPAAIVHLTIPTT